MTALLAIVPAPYRWLILAALLAAYGLFCFVKGAEHEEAKEAARELQVERATAARAASRSAVTAKVDLKYAPALTQIRTVTQETIRYVTKLIPADSCPLPGGFRVLHDAAAQGRVPDPAGSPDAAAVPAQAAADTVVDNYGTCLATAKQLEGLQEWIREQQKLNPQ